MLILYKRGQIIVSPYPIVQTSIFNLLTNNQSLLQQKEILRHYYYYYNELTF